MHLRIGANRTSLSSGTPNWPSPRVQDFTGYSIWRRVKGQRLRMEVSADWLARLHASTEEEPWVHGFSLVHRETGTAVGRGGFKGPPTADGVVEIAYAIVPDHQGKGYATEAAEALTRYAFESSQVRVVRAHTLPEANASTRVLTKCSFRFTGEVIDPEDELVWRWEKQQGQTVQRAALSEG